MSSTERLFQQAMAWHQLGLFDAACRTYRDVLQRRPGHEHAWHMLGLAAIQDGRVESGVDLLRKRIAETPNDASIRVTLGEGLRRLGRRDDARLQFDAAIELTPNDPWVWYNRGLLSLESGRADDALADLDMALTLRPDDVATLNERGKALSALGRRDEALASFERAVALAPDSVEAHCNRGNAYLDLLRPQEAVDSFSGAIALRADHAPSFCNRGNALLALSRHDEAVADYEQAIALSPPDASLWLNRGGALGVLGRYDAALDSFDKALELEPDSVAVRWNKALFLLGHGRFREAWPLYEARKDLPIPLGNRIFSQPLWTGEQSLSGKTLLIYAEQGFGDAIQFCRYATMAANAGARVVLEVSSALTELMKTLSGVAEIIAEGEQPAGFDLQCPMMSLPRAFGTTLETIPAPVRYLRADPEQAQIWRNRVSHLRGRRIGLVWAGAARHWDPAAAGIDRRRSIPLDALAPLASVPGCHFISLQIGPTARQAASPPPGMIIHDLTRHIQTFADTAALIENLDLVLAVDTSTAHLAAAMGKPVWLLNRYDSCWRWLRDRDDSPWYPTLTQFRQSAQGDWGGVIERVTQRLASLSADARQ